MTQKMEEPKRVNLISINDFVEKNGKTVLETNLERQHKIPLGSVVEVEVNIYSCSDDQGIKVDLKGNCKLYVVGHSRDCDGTPLYVISELPVMYPIDDTSSFSQEKMRYRMIAKIIEYGYSEYSLKPTGERGSLHRSISEWLRS